MQDQKHKIMNLTVIGSLELGVRLVTSKPHYSQQPKVSCFILPIEYPYNLTSITCGETATHVQCYIWLFKDSKCRFESGTGYDSTWCRGERMYGQQGLLQQGQAITTHGYEKGKYRSLSISISSKVTRPNKSQGLITFLVPLLLFYANKNFKMEILIRPHEVSNERFEHFSVFPALKSNSSYSKKWNRH